MNAYMFNLRDAHSWLAIVGFHQFVWVIQRSAHSNNDFYTRLFRLLDDLGISLSSIRIGILFKDQMRNLPFLEKLRQDCLGSFSHHKQFRIGVELCNGGGEVGLTIKSMDTMLLEGASYATSGGIALTGTATYSYQPELGIRSEGPSTKEDTGTRASSQAQLSEQASHGDASPFETSR